MVTLEMVHELEDLIAEGRDWADAEHEITYKYDLSDEERDTLDELYQTGEE